MKTISLVDKLRIASHDPTAISRIELTALLRRAALRIDNMSSGLDFGPIYEEGLAEVAAELDVSRDGAIKGLVCDWLMANGYVPADALEEDGEVAGNA